MTDLSRRRRKPPVRNARERSPIPTESVPTETHKLQKLLALAGLGSRRDMEEWIREGRVTVNGEKATIGTRATSSDKIKVDGRLVRLNAIEKPPRILLYHKPEGEIVSRDDPEGRPSVFDQLPRMRGAKWIAIGRLDFNTSGLLIFTTSGSLANKMMHPSFEIEREYAVRIRGSLTPEQIIQLKNGITLEDGLAKLDKVEDEGGEGTNHWYRVVLREGRNREVRRIFETLGCPVTRLIRVRYGEIQLPPRLRRGQRKELDPETVEAFVAWLDNRGLLASEPLEPTRLPIPRVKSAKAQRPRTPRVAGK